MLICNAGIGSGLLSRRFHQPTSTPSEQRRQRGRFCLLLPGFRLQAPRAPPPSCARDTRRVWCRRPEAEQPAATSFSSVLLKCNDSCQQAFVSQSLNQRNVGGSGNINEFPHMRPDDSVFAIGGDDDSDQDEDLLAQGARRLGALAAEVSNAAESPPPNDAKTVSPAGIASEGPPGFAAAACPASGRVSVFPRGGARATEVHPPSPSTASSRRTPTRLHIEGKEHQQKPSAHNTRKGPEKTTSSSQTTHHASATGDSTPAYKPEVDGPPIIG